VDAEERRAAVEGRDCSADRGRSGADTPVGVAATSAVNDFLFAAFAWVCAASNATEQGTQSPVAATSLRSVPSG